MSLRNKLGNDNRLSVWDRNSMRLSLRYRSVSILIPLLYIYAHVDTMDGPVATLRQLHNLTQFSYLFKTVSKYGLWSCTS